MRHRFYITAMLGLSLLMAAPAQAQITMISSDSTAGTGVASAQLAGFTVGSGESLLVMVAMENNGAVSDIQFNSSSVNWDTVVSVNEGPQQAQIYLVDGLSGTGDIDFTFSDNGTFAVSAMSLSGVAGVSGSGTFGEPDGSLPFAINYGGAAGGFVVGAMVDNTFSGGNALNITGGNVDTYLEQIAGTGTESAGRGLAYGDIAATGSFTETFDKGDGSSGRNAGALLALYPTGLVNQNLTWSGGTSGSSDTWDTFGNANWNANADVFQPGDTVTFDDTAGVATTVNINGSVIPANTTVDSDTNNYTFASGDIGGNGTLTKSGTSTLILETGHSYSGGTIVNGGILDIGDPGTAGTGAVTLNGTAQFHVGDASNNTVGNDFVVNGTNVIENNSINARLLNLIGNISGSGDLTLNNNSGGGLNGIDLSGDNSGFSGSVTLGGGDTVFLRLRGSVNAAGTDVAWDTGAGGRIYTRDLDPTVSITLGSLSGSGGFLGANAGGAASAVEYRIGSLNTSTTFSGVVEDNGGTTSITKIGTGTLTLDGANTYSGDTSVEAGTLSISEDYLNDAADVYLTTGATLNLDFASTGGSAGDFDNSSFVDGADFILWQQNTGVGSLTDWEADYGTGGGTPTVDTIDQLFIDGVAQATGTWGAIGSGAANETALISGLGWLNVTTTAVASAAAVPEPCAALLCVSFALGLGLRRNRS